jgi:hypothetical protein
VVSHFVSWYDLSRLRVSHSLCCSLFDARYIERSSRVILRDSPSNHDRASEDSESVRKQLVRRRGGNSNVQDTIRRQRMLFLALKHKPLWTPLTLSVWKEIPLHTVGIHNMAIPIRHFQRSKRLQIFEHIQYTRFFPSGGNYQSHIQNLSPVVSRVDMSERKAVLRKLQRVLWFAQSLKDSR